MAIREAYGYPSDAAVTTEAATSTARPGAGSLLALMWIAACAMAGWRHEDIVVALMTQGVLDESTVLDGLTVMKWASMAGAAVGLAAMLPAMLWALTTVGRWRPVRASAAQVSQAVTPIARPVVMVTAAVVTGVAGIAHSLVGYAGTAIYGLARGTVLVGAFALHYLALGITRTAMTIRFVLSALLAVAGAVAEFVSPAFILAGRTVALLAMLTWRALAAAYTVFHQAAVHVVQIGGEVLRLLERLVRFALGQMGAAVVAVAHIARPVLVYMLRILAEVWSVATRVLGTVVSHLGVIAMAVARAAGRAAAFVLQQASTATATAFSYLSAGVSITAHGSVLAASKLAVATGAVIAVAWLGGVIVAVAAGDAMILVGRGLFTLLSYLWAVVWWGIKAASNAVVVVLGYAWWAVAAISRLLWTAVTALLRRAGAVVATVFRHVWAAFAAVSRLLWAGVTLVSRLAWAAVLIIARVLALVVRLLAVDVVWRAIVLGAKVSGFVLRHTWQGIYIVARYMSVGARMSARAVGFVATPVLAVAWSVVRTLFGYMWIVLKSLAISVAISLKILAIVIARVVVTVWRVGTLVASVIGQVLWHVWGGVLETLGLLKTAAVASASVVIQAMGYLWAGVSIALGTGRQAVGVVARTAAVVLDYAELRVYSALKYLWEGAVFATRIAALALSFFLAVVVKAVRYIAAEVAIAAGMVTRVSVFLWDAVVIAAQAAAAVLVAASLAAASGAWAISRVVLILVRPIAVASTTIAALTRWALAPVRQAAAAIGAFLGLGVSSAALAGGWLALSMWCGILAALRAGVLVLALVPRALQTGPGVVPDMYGYGVAALKFNKGGRSMSEFNLTRDRLASLVVTMLVAFLAVAVVVRLLWPAPPEPTVVVSHWVTGHLYFGADLPDIAEEYNKAGHRTKDGKRIVIEIHNAPSSEGSRALTARVTGKGKTTVHGGGEEQVLPDPTIITPSGAHWLVNVNHQAGRKVVDPDSAKSLALAYIGIITFREMAECLGWPDREIGYADIIALRNDPLGWGRYPDCAKAEWGKQPLVAFTDPRTSSTGRGLLIALYSIAADKLPEELTLDDVSDPNVVDYVEGFQGLIDHYLIPS